MLNAENAEEIVMSKYGRWQKDIIKKALLTRRVVLLAGPRQCGKTTLVKQLVSSDVEYRTLDSLAARDAAAKDPEDFVMHSGETLIIDEVQRIPDLIIAIKKVVDEDTRPGQYLLTGSANIATLPTVKESLAGRIRKIRLRTLSQGEIRGTPPAFLERAFERNFKFGFNPITKEEVVKTASIGGFPEPLTLNERDRREWHSNYITTLLERDLAELYNLEKHDTMGKLVDILCAWSSKYMDMNAIAAGLGVQWRTLDSYINALAALYLVERVPPWRNTDYDRVGKKPKIFMADSGLMFSLLGWNLEQLRFQPDMLGKLIETFAYNEIATQAEANPGLFEVFHYRDRERREIDFIIMKEKQSILAIEIKASNSVSASDFKHMTWFQKHLAKGRPFVGIVLYTGEIPLSFGDNKWAIPFGMLWAD